MRKNLPVTTNEFVLPDDTPIVSKTDTKGKLTYYNEQFVTASGFTEAELMGQPHNAGLALRAFQQVYIIADCQQLGIDQLPWDPARQSVS